MLKQFVVWYSFVMKGEDTYITKKEKKKSVDASFMLYIFNRCGS